MYMYINYEMYTTDVKKWNFWFYIDIVNINSFDIDIYRYQFLLDISDTICRMHTDLGCP